MRELRRMLAPLAVLAVLALPVGAAVAASPPPPTVTTGAASGVTTTTATLNGTVNPNGSSTTYQFQFGPTIAYGSTTQSAAPVPNSGTTAVAVRQTLTNLSPNTTYHYRIVATNPHGTTAGADQAFTTPGLVSTVRVLAPTAFVSPHGVLGVGIGCLGGSTTCQGTLSLSRGSTVYVSRGFTLAPETGGFAHMGLSSSAMRALFTNYTRPVAVRLRIHTAAGQYISQIIYLVRWY